MQLPLFIGPVAWDLAERRAAATRHGSRDAGVQVLRGGKLHNNHSGSLAASKYLLAGIRKSGN